MKANVYTAALMEHNAHPDYKYDLEDFTLEHEGINPSCGDEMVLKLRLSEDGTTIEEAAFTGSGCAVSQASADIMAELITALDSAASAAGQTRLGAQVKHCQLMCVCRLAAFAENPAGE